MTSMPISGQEKIIEEGGAAKKTFEVVFSNGALTQLESLKEFYKQANLNDVVELAVGVLQRIKDQDQPNNKEKSNS